MLGVEEVCVLEHKEHGRQRDEKGVELRFDDGDVAQGMRRWYVAFA